MIVLPSGGQRDNNPVENIPVETRSSVPSDKFLRRRHRWRHGRWAEDLRADLQRLSVMLFDSPVPVYLVGGLGLAVRSEGFYRNHGDIDLAVFIDQLPHLLDHVNARGYELAEARIGLALSPWHRLDVSHTLRVEDALRSPGDHSLRLKRTGLGNYTIATERTDYIDLLPLSHTDEGVHIHGYRRTVPYGDFYPVTPWGPVSPATGGPVSPATGRPGGSLCLPNVSYKSHLPSGWRRQRRDLAIAGLG